MVEGQVAIAFEESIPWEQEILSRLRRAGSKCGTSLEESRRALEI